MRPFKKSHRMCNILIVPRVSIIFCLKLTFLALSGKIKYYRPLATRTATLIILLVATLLLIALLEYSCHVITQHSGFGSTAEELVNITRSKLNERNADKHQKRAGEASLPNEISPSTPVGSAASPSLATTPMTSSTKSTTQTIFNTAASTYLTAKATTNIPVPIVMLLTSEYVSKITGFQPPIKVPIFILNPTTAGKGSSPSNEDTAVDKVPFTSIKVSDSTTIEVIIFTSTSNNSDRTLVEPIITSSSPIRIAPSTSNGSQNEPTTGNPTSVPTGTARNDSSMLVIVSTFKSVYEITIFHTSSSTTVDRPVATSANSSGTFLYHSNGAVTAPDQITYRQYLTASFLPLLLAMFYAIPWRILENTVRYMEPLYQLRPFSHSTVSEAIHIDYESPSIFILPFKSLSRIHLTMFITSLISVMMLAVAPLASQVMIVVESNYCVGTGLATCDSWGIYPSFARLLKGLLGSIAIFTLFLIFAGLRRDSGVNSEPLSLAGLAVIRRKTPLSIQAINDSETKLEEEDIRISTQGYTF
ncbi:uncharacterized protein EAF02_010196 [Botrytis sinoallii]|uniref:uncharacterized protein n=1 Tax=Botrytis sinoallii TaxID=1463999 RepID=UPI0019022516|nr:uncharacterized protein EAF02_010196 [Botrytis sinoallii]KAF7864228.1 hypothetical protein EAF02_010196 [Botrytis sinoallii]